jgi:NO-binding membrane sensor protein with MHYT domain
MRIAHDPLLVILSLLVAMQASYVGLRLAIRVQGSVGLHRKMLLAGAAVSLAVGIWSMHFVGMLAARLPNVDYLVLPTLISFLVCVLVVGIAIVTASLWPATWASLLCAAVVMGGGIAIMHYIGMYALHASAHMMYDPAYAAASVGIGIAASGLALWLAFACKPRPPLLVCAAVLGLGISGLHYTAMAGMTLHPMSETTASPALSPDLLAVVVAVVAFLVSGLFLLTLVPDRSLAAPATAAPPSALPEPEPAPATEAPAEPKGLPVEREGMRETVPPEEVFAVHANAHYTYVFNGRETLFCSLSIGDAWASLAGGSFLRVHRSHIVNLDRVVSLRKAGDNGVAELAGEVPTRVPVSRAKLAELRACLAKRSRHSEPLRAPRATGSRDEAGLRA